MSEVKNFFEEGSLVDVSKWIEKKQDKLDYLEWASSWILCRTKYPKAKFILDKNENDRPWFTDPESGSGWVSGTIIIPELDYELSDVYEVMDFKNGALKGDKIDSVAANKAKRRLMAKLIAEATGIGIHLYIKSDSTSDEKEVELAKEKLSDIYKKKVKVSDKAKAEAEKVVSDTNEKINSAIDNQEKLNIYAEAREELLKIRK